MDNNTLLVRGVYECVLHVTQPSTLSIKLSALHPRYELHNIEEVKAILMPQLLKLVKHAAAHKVPITIDAEEADRLELCLDLFKQVTGGVLYIYISLNL